MKKAFIFILTVGLVVSMFLPRDKIYAAEGEEAESQSYEKMRLKWFNRLTGNDQFNPDDPHTAAYVENLVSKVKNGQQTGYWDKLNRSKDRNHLWSDLTSASDSADVSNNYYRLRDMAYAYVMKGSELYQNKELREDIINGLDWMYANRYNENQSQYGNWWNWEIGAPAALKDLLVLMYDDLTESQQADYIKAIDNFVPNSTDRVRFPGVIETGANRTDKALIVSVRGIVGKNGDKIAEARDALSREFKYTTSGDGFYQDGSFIQHDHVPYTGSYGSVLVDGLSNLLYLLRETPWEVTDPNASNVYHWAKDSFAPLIYKGAMMDMVRGRAISRQNSSDHTTGRTITLSLLRLSEGLPPEQAMEIKSMAKEWIQADTTFSDYFEGLNIYDVILAKNLMNDGSIEPRGEFSQNQIFAAMDRAVHHRPEFAFGVSMSSKRISSMEMGTHSGAENTKGWHTGYGMTYLYNNDLKQYSNDYWPTVDMFRLAGTTTDGAKGSPLESWSPYFSSKTWVGGSNMDGVFGAAGMEFDLENSTLTGKKSWFMFDDEIVAVGSGITGNDDRKAETIIENRQLQDNGENRLIVNGETKPKESGWQETMDQVKWAHLQGNVANSDIGYFFPEDSTVSALREARTGSWSDINVDGSKDPVTRHYLSLAFDHGVNPDGADYEYVLLPGKSSEETKQYAKNSDITILENSVKAHAVKKDKLGILAANFFESTPHNVDFIRSYGPASVIVQEKGDELTLSVSDPTQTQSKIKLDLGKVSREVISQDDTIKVSDQETYTEVDVNVSGSIGKTHTLKLKIDENAGKLPEEILPAEIVLDQDELHLNSKNLGVAVHAQVLPENTWVKEIKWSSSDPSIATVNDNGYVSAVSEGTAIITAESIRDSNVRAQLSVKVEEMEGFHIPFADAYVQSGGSANTNFGSAPSLVVKSDVSGYGRKSYLKFDVGQIERDKLESVVLRLYANGVNSDPERTINLYATDHQWEESGITWNNAPEESELLSSVTVTKAEEWYEFDLTEYFKVNEVGEIISFLAMNPGPNTQKNDVSFTSREGDENKPQLIVSSIQEPEASAPSIKRLVEQLAEKGEFADDQVPHALKQHLTAVGHFEEQEKAAKVVKHMISFKLLLDQYKEEKQLSETAYHLLKKNANRLIAEWQ
ncbi:polysaccharide lyase family 8 super-sandwich domain-containing protein [Bacillus sp. SD088]|uniref:polysaccharide lyase family 8 super-sandwich domain-containing protein n=1 Tax=Bacillus sp. SD088 TaxID=2782012 RepID=UPI001A972239|nr:polysaccharide lyase family 8 super-sandwich domain-containing protein [Bacillus sp. SD088]MBO0991632.1 DNRLRE domain-containing protein [Bacillus sp. SD088]